MRIVRVPSSPVSMSIAAPKAASMRSVWSRVATGSITVVVPRDVEAGKEERRLHLRRGHRQAVLDRDRNVRPLDGSPAAGRRNGRRSARPCARSGSKTRPIGRRDERGVAGEGGGEGMAAGKPHRQPDAGAGIAVVDDRLGLEQPADADALDAPGADVRAARRWRRRRASRRRSRSRRRPRAVPRSWSRRRRARRA